MNEEGKVEEPGVLNEEQSNDQKLAHFQELTHLDDFEQCQAILESTGWNLDQAIQSYFSSNLNATDDDAIPVEVELPQPPPLQPIVSTINIPPSLSYNQQQETLNSFFTNLTTQALGVVHNRRLLTFNIEYLTNKFTLHVSDTEKVSKLKELVEEKTEIPRKHIKLSGWRNKGIFISDFSVLSELNLPLENNLYVVNMQTIADDIQNATANIPGVACASGSSVTQPEHETYEIYIKLINSGDEKFFRLNFGPQVKFIEIRRRLATLTGLIANDQEWWYFKQQQSPSNKSAEADDECLADFKTINSEERFAEAQSAEKILGIALNTVAEDGLTLVRIKHLVDELSGVAESKQTPSCNKLFFLINSRCGLNPSTSNQTEQASQATSEFTGTSNVEDYDGEDTLMTSQEEELDEHFLANEESDNITKRKALITAECPQGDELEGTNMFREEFLVRYGPMIPLFYAGKFEDAIRDALVCPARERRLLGIYLHSDQTVFCNIFAAQTLCDETVINFLTSNFIVWPWDLTIRQNEQHFYDVCSKHFGSPIASQLRSHKDKLPLFLIVNRVRATNEITAIVQGDCTSDQMMGRLMQCSEMFEMQRMKDEHDERERDERERIKREQDQAYRESLEFDKAKRQRHAEEEEIKKKEKEIEQLEKRKLLENIETRKSDALKRLPNEPDINQTNVAKIRFRLPNGETWQRRFTASDKLSSVLDFMTSHGYFTEEYKLLSSWPRRDLTTESIEKTLEELKLFPQETLTLEQR